MGYFVVGGLGVFVGAAVAAFTLYSVNESPREPGGLRELESVKGATRGFVTPSRPATDSEFRRELRRLRQEVGALKQQAAQQQAALERSTLQENLVAEAQTLEAIDQPQRASLEPTPVELYEAEGKQEHDASWQRRQEEWAKPAERRLEEALLQWDVPGTELLRVDCRSSVCRAEVFHADAESERLFQEEFASSLISPEFGGVIIEHHADAADGAGSLLHLTSPPPQLAEELQELFAARAALEGEE